MLPTLGANHCYGQLAQATWFVRGGGIVEWRSSARHGCQSGRRELVVAQRVNIPTLCTRVEIGEATDDWGRGARGCDIPPLSQNG
jgi:hypothetical protein